MAVLPKVVYVLGNLNVDYLIPAHHFRGGGLVKTANPKSGGTAINAALAFRRHGFQPVIIGGVGKDRGGDFIKLAIEKNRLAHCLCTSASRPTGTCHIVYSNRRRKSFRYFLRNHNDANRLDLRFVQTDHHA